MLLDVVAVAALAGLLAVAFAHPRGRTETLAGLAAAGAVLAVGAVSLEAAGEQVERMLPVVLFLAAILVVAETCAAEGLFAAVGDAVRRAGRGDPHRVLLVTFLAASLITAALSLDATVVLLTPVVAAAVAGSRSERPVVHACVRLANSASLLLPVSNLTNLLALPDVDLSFLGWFLVMAPVWVVVIAVEYVGVRVYFAGDLRAPAPRPEGEPLPLPRFPVVVVLLMLAGFVAGSAYDLEPFWVAGAAALVLVVRAVRAGHLTPVGALHSTHASFGVFVLCLGVVVAALDGSFLGALVEDLLPAGLRAGLAAAARAAGHRARQPGQQPARDAAAGAAGRAARHRGGAGHHHRPQRRLGADLPGLAGEPAVAAHPGPAGAAGQRPHLPPARRAGHAGRAGRGRGHAVGGPGSGLSAPARAPSRRPRWCAARCPAPSAATG